MKACTSDAWIIIPAYNEEKHIQQIARAVREKCDHVIVIDDGSRDHTAELASAEKVIVLRHRINLGKGAAIRTGCDFAVQHDAKKLILMDADGQHKPEDIPRFVELLNEKDIVFGYRKRNQKMPAVMRFGNWFMNRMTQVLYGITLQDTQCGFRGLTADAYQKIRWQARDYSMESEMIANAGKNKLSYAELPIDTIYHDKYKGTTVFDGVKIVLNMFLWKMRGR